MGYYTTNDKDMLDWICWRHYGRSSGAFEAVLAANPGLEDYPAILPPGLVIRLPVIAPTPRKVSVVRLWD